jgi:C-terminal processing protease CtpA/Prc
LTIISVKKTGLARRAGIRVGDVITQINDTPADQLTLIEAQMEIHESGRFVKIYVKG